MLFFNFKEKETKLVDTNAGFFIEETEEGESSTTLAEPIPAPVVQPDRPECEECQEALADSYLFRNFGVFNRDGKVVQHFKSNNLSYQ